MLFSLIHYYTIDPYSVKYNFSYKKLWYLHKNSLDVKYGVALFNGQCEKSCEIKGGGQESAVTV